jgi:hypothetical protein
MELVGNLVEKWVVGFGWGDERRTPVELVLKVLQMFVPLSVHGYGCTS